MLQENDAKRDRAIKKAASEQEAQRVKDKEIEKYIIQLNSIQAFSIDYK